MVRWQIRIHPEVKAWLHGQRADSKTAHAIGDAIEHFAFDPTRRMLLLVAGDKAGKWRQWYDEAIPLAEARYEEMINEVES